MDRFFGSPKINFYLNYYSNQFRKSLTYYYYLNVYARIIKDKIDILLADAYDADTEINISINET